MDVSVLRNLLVKGMLLSLVVAAVIAIVAILVGEFGDIAWKAIFTVLAALIHIGILLGVISMTSTSIENLTISRARDVVLNVSISIAVLSFLTSVFATWGIIYGSVTFKLYVTYIVAMIATLHAKVLVDAQAVHPKVGPYVYANYAFMAIVSVIILVVAWVDIEMLSGFTGRLLAASAVGDVTLTIIVLVMLKLHVQNNPELASINKSKESSILSGIGKFIAGLVIGVIVLIFGLWFLLRAIAGSIF